MTICNSLTLFYTLKALSVKFTYSRVLFYSTSSGQRVLLESGIRRRRAGNKRRAWTIWQKKTKQNVQGYVEKE